MIGARRCFGTALAVALWLCAGLFANAASQRPSQDSLNRFFEDVAFGSEFPQAGKAREILLKWQGPIRVSVSDLSGTLKVASDGTHFMKMEKRVPRAEAWRQIENHMATLAELTGLVITKQADAGQPANVFIKLVPPLAMHAPFLVPDVAPATLREMAIDGVCYATLSHEAGLIRRAVIVVNRDLEPARMEACLLEEMTQVLGLMNDSDIVQPSIFNQFSTRRSLSRNDLILILTLYDNKLKPGMPMAQAMPVAQAIMAHLNEILE